MARSLSLEACMVKNPVKIRADATILDAVRLILEHKVSGVCVIDENNQLVGMLSELDCLRAIIERVYIRKESSPGYVYEAMTRQVETKKPGDDIVSVAASMLENKRRRRPVVDDNRLVGQVTCRQILGAINEFI